MKQPIIPQLSAEEFLRWEEAQSLRFELHHGFAVAYAGGTVSHDRVSFRARGLLARLYPSPCETFGRDVKVRVSEATFYYCDAGVRCDPIDDDATVIERPHVVVEVLSRSTRPYDIVEKRAAYRAMNCLAAYVIIHTDMRRIEVDARATNGRWSTGTYGDDEAYLNGQAFVLDEVYGRL
ncbi:MAG: Uma2 family endonuclease [Candidatus Eremiobacteraeota bacterium]|nr:Uma2 family endonuclease [Candidatus Eremiobacteraeota bacterium]MBC5802134.1 Uma2 family endonuclease [Candidatus Eremiobacteraeota bacterium]MBC5820958.1 Uma2 family endonuclease [Candidatus Eremiobacteraeota bacterium]